MAAKLSSASRSIPATREATWRLDGDLRRSVLLVAFLRWLLPSLTKKQDLTALWLDGTSNR